MLISNLAIRDALIASGWSEDRSVDIATWVNELEKAGYTMNQKSREVLTSFGGLTIQPLISDAQAYQPLPVRFDPMLNRWLARPVPWEEQLKTTLSPVGECFEDSSLFIDDCGRLYAIWSGMMQRLGDDFEDSLSTLVIADKRGRRVKLQKSP